MGLLSNHWVNGLYFGGAMMDGPDLTGLKVLVVGLGATGRETAHFLLDRDARVTVTDRRSFEELSESAGPLAERCAHLELGGHRIETFEDSDVIVVSPGVPQDIEPLLRAKAKGIPVTGEIELASRYVSAPVIAVTGTNGKTTTTSLIGEIFLATGQNVFVGGNIGRPLIEFVRNGGKADLVVLELSSFQLETAVTLKPRVGVLLNVTPDHLDRYPGFEDYFQAKERLFKCQDADDFAVINADDPLAVRVATQGRCLAFSRKSRPSDGAYVENDRIVFVESGREIAGISTEALTMVGAHNQENLMAAVLSAVVMGVDPDDALAVAAKFKGLPHRVEFVAEKAGVRFYDDSKGTNVAAVEKSLEGFREPVILIAGGRDKAGNFESLKGIVREKVKLLILIGEAAGKIEQALGRETDTVRAKSMEEAVDLASARAVAGDVVLLSPACASFDMFDSYAHRGKVFADRVKEALVS